MKTEVGRNMPRQAEKWAEFLLRHWLLVLGSENFVPNDLNDDFVVVPGVYHEDTSLCAAMVEVSFFRSPLKCMYTLHLAIVPEGMNI
ncbi:hypothetical protein V6N12_012686 [Hibiscus sabdariffa]|uniref:Uncharacterized protein n=1 Tax=Hibiscus sabdariffa TaxID=183260 RepID=A0ABR2DE92_9ROSI